MFVMLALLACGGPKPGDTGTPDTAGDTAPHGDTAPDDTAWKQLDAQETDGGAFYVSYTSEPDPIPMNAPFALRFKVHEGADHDAVITDATLTLDALMPAHGHGMSTVPTITVQGDGTILAENLTFQMGGWWTVEVTVTRGEVTDATTFYVECCE